MKTTIPWLVCALLCAPQLAFAQKLPIAVMELAGRGVDEAAAGALTTEVSNTLADIRVFQVITREDIKRMLQLEQTKQQCTGKVDAACMAEIGGALGVEFLIYGEVAKISGTYSLSLVLLDIQNATAKSRANRKISDPRILLEETATATKLLVAPLLAERKGFLILETKEEGARVELDGRLLGVTPMGGRLELPMGAHELVVKKEGFLQFARTIDVVPDQATVEVVGLVPNQTFINDYESGAVVTRAFAWTTAGLGAAGLLAGIALKLIADARFDDLVAKGYLTKQADICTDLNPNYNGSDFCPTPLGFDNDVGGSVSSVETTDTVALLSLGGGLLSAAISTYLFATGDDPGRYRAYGTTAAPVTSVGISPRGATLTIGF